MDELKNQTILIPSVTHSEAAIQAIEEFPRYGVYDISCAVLSRTNRVYSTHYSWRVAAS